MCLRLTKGQISLANDKEIRLSPGGFIDIENLKVKLEIRA